MGQIKFYNLLPKIDAENNFITQSFQVSKIQENLNCNLEFIFAFNRPKSLLTNLKTRSEITRSYNLEYLARKQLAKLNSEEFIGYLSVEHDITKGILPYDGTAQDALLNEFAQELLLPDTQEKAQKILASKPYRILYSPKSIANTLASNDFKDMMYREVDLCIGQESINRVPSPNYFRLPNWAVELFGICPTIAEIEQVIQSLEAKRKQNPLARQKFLGLVANSDRKVFLQGVRGIILDLVADDAQLSNLVVESAGKFANNTQDLSKVYDNNLIAYLEQFSFNLVSESINFLGYVSEKISVALKAGCIPIYWGDIYEDQDIFNLDALVLFDPSKRIQLVPKLKQILANPQEFIAKDIFLPNAAKNIYRKFYAPIYAKIEEDLNLDLYQYRTNPVDPQRLNTKVLDPQPELFRFFLS